MKSCPQCGAEYDGDIKFCPLDGTTLRVPTGGNLIGAVIADRYHVLRKLGEGGMGQVYLAEHVKMGRPSAIKVMSPTMMNDADAISRFNREAANAAKITHPNVAAIYDFGETTDGLVYLAMEYIEGESLTTVMEREGPLPPTRTADIARQVASALDAAHERAIVHRDLKPDNIMIARNRDGSDLVKVVDFGIAKAQHGHGQKVTKTGLVVGTPEYMSPEQLSGDTLDGRSDTYTLGLVTFHMLTAQLPFPSATLQESMIRRLTDRPRTLAEMRPDVEWPAALQRVLDRALARDANERYRHASDFASDLARAVVGMPTVSRSTPTQMGTQLLEPIPPTRARGTGTTEAPASTRVRAAPPARRPAWPIALAAAVLVVIGAALALRPRGASSAGTLVVADSARGDTSRFMRPTDSAPTPPRVDSTLTRPVSVMRADTHATATRPPAARPHPTAPAPVPATAPAPSTDRTTVGGAADEDTAAPAEKLGAERARIAVERASQLLLQERTDVAIALLRRALPNLTSRADSITALYHLSEGLFQRSERRHDAEAHARACSILGFIRQDPTHRLASSISYMYNAECK